MNIKVTSQPADFLQQIPPQPGVYRYYANDGSLLYVGKAINLLKRVKSYFQRTADLSPRISLMVAKIAEIEVTVTENETSALLLESNLIKSLKPKYNIVFRDDKSYPYIKISSHLYPVIEYYRGSTVKAGEALFGPYPNSYAVREVLDLLQRLFKLRTCSDNTFASRKRPCMLHQVGLCCAPCVNLVTPGEYREFVNYGKELLQGEYGDLISRLSEQMYTAADQLDFEQAGNLRDKIGLIKELQHKQIISDSQSPINADIVQLVESGSQVFIYLIIIRNGLYVGDKHFSHRKVDTASIMLQSFLESYYATSQQTSLVFLTDSIEPDFISEFWQLYQIRLNLQPSGRIAELAKMGRKNLQKVIESSQLDNIYEVAAIKLAEFLGIAQIKRMECYDTSHNQGQNTVAAMTVFAAGKIDHSLYRKYNLPSSLNGDDLLALTSVLRRRLANSELPVPEVIVVDGGKTQLAAAKKLMEELGFHDKIKLVAIFKGEQRKPELDRIIINSSLQLNFREEPAIFRLLQGLRDEAHRFAITGHRKKQIERMQVSRLNEIPGIGVKKRKALIAFFGSPQGVASATHDQLLQVEGIGAELATTIYNFFHE